NAPTATLMHGVLNEGRSHELGSAFLAIVGALVFGVGFGRVLQLVHTRAWGLPLPPRQIDQALYGLVLIGLYGLLLLLLVQLSELKGDPEWVGLSLAVGWVGLLVLFFVWAPWMLTRKLITPRDLLPSAVLTAGGIVVLMVVSRFVMQFWVDWYARDYGGVGGPLARSFLIALRSPPPLLAAPPPPPAAPT